MANLNLNNGDYENLGASSSSPCSVCSSRIHEALLIVIGGYKLCAACYDKAKDRADKTDLEEDDQKLSDDVDNERLVKDSPVDSVQDSLQEKVISLVMMVTTLSDRVVKCEQYITEKEEEVSLLKSLIVELSRHNDSRVVGIEELRRDVAALKKSNEETLAELSLLKTKAMASHDSTSGNLCHNGISLPATLPLNLSQDRQKPSKKNERALNEVHGERMNRLLSSSDQKSRMECLLSPSLDKTEDKNYNHNQGGDSERDINTQKSDILGNEFFVDVLESQGRDIQSKKSGITPGAKSEVLGPRFFKTRDSSHNHSEPPEEKPFRSAHLETEHTPPALMDVHTNTQFSNPPCDSMDRSSPDKLAVDDLIPPESMRAFEEVPYGEMQNETHTEWVARELNNLTHPLLQHRKARFFSVLVKADKNGSFGTILMKALTKNILYLPSLKDVKIFERKWKNNEGPLFIMVRHQRCLSGIWEVAGILQVIARTHEVPHDPVWGRYGCQVKFISTARVEDLQVSAAVRPDLERQVNPQMARQFIKTLIKKLQEGDEKSVSNLFNKPEYTTGGILPEPRKTSKKVDHLEPAPPALSPAVLTFSPSAPVFTPSAQVYSVPYE